MTSPQFTVKVLTLIISVFFVTSCSFERVRYLPPTEALVAFAEIAINGDNANTWNKQIHPFIGATAIDVDGDGAMEIFVGGGDGHPDRLFVWRDSALHDIIKTTILSEKQATHGANSIDLDDDGDTDLLLARNKTVFSYMSITMAYLKSGKFRLICHPIQFR